MTNTEQELRREILALKHELATVNAQLEGNLPSATAWLQTKVWNQKRELDRLNRRVTSQRLRLRTIAALGRDLTKEEYLAAKAELHPATQERIEEFEPVA